jgi:hypothetical protein
MLRWIVRKDMLAWYSYGSMEVGSIVLSLIPYSGITLFKF